MDKLLIIYAILQTGVVWYLINRHKKYLDEHEKFNIQFSRDFECSVDSYMRTKERYYRDGFESYCRTLSKQVEEKGKDIESIVNYLKTHIDKIESENFIDVVVDRISRKQI